MRHLVLNRRHFLAGVAALSPIRFSSAAAAETPASGPSPDFPSRARRILLACKLGMIAAESGGRKLTLVERLRMAAQAGFDGVDFDEAGAYTPDQVRAAVRESGVFVHNAINHAHWEVRLTDPDPNTRSRARANLEHCLRVSHAAGGSGVLIVVGKGEDGPAAEIEERCRSEIRQCLPLAAALGQMILVENVWNRMMYDHDRGPEQSPERFIRFVDSFNSPWVGLYYDVGNHWKYGQPPAWIRALGRRCVKLDIKGFSRAKNKFVEIGGEEDDLPWAEVRAALADIGFTGWATAEVGGGGVERLATVRAQMARVLLGA